MKKYQWDMLEWLLDNFFERWGVGKIEGREYGGYVYVGEVRNGKMYGHGRCTYSSGSVYEGEWKNGDWHGHGKYTYPGGSVAEGRYELNVFMQPEPRPPSTNSNHRESLQENFLHMWSKEMLARLLNYSLITRPIWIRMPGMPMG